MIEKKNAVQNTDAERAPLLRVLLETQGDHLPEGFAVLLHHLLVCDPGLQHRGFILQRQHQDLTTQRGEEIDRVQRNWLLLR